MIHHHYLPFTYETALTKYSFCNVEFNQQFGDDVELGDKFEFVDILWNNPEVPELCCLNTGSKAKFVPFKIAAVSAV